MLLLVVPLIAFTAFLAEPTTTFFDLIKVFPSFLIFLSIKSVISFHRIDCNDMGYQIILMSFYGKYMGRGENLTHFIDPDTEEEKRFHPKDSISYSRHKKLCN